MPFLCVVPFDFVESIAQVSGCVNSFWGASDRIKNGIQKVENAYGQSTPHFIIIYEKLGRVEKVIGKIPAYNLCT